MSPDLRFELLAITSIVSFLVMGGLLGLWAATSRWHWFGRAMVVVCLLALVQWRPLYELYLTLLTQVAVIAVGVAVYRREIWQWRFSVAGLLMLTVIVSVVVASVMREPEKEFTWQSGLMGVGFGVVGGLLTLLGSWLVVSQRRLRWRVLLAFLAILVLGYGWGLSNQLAHQFVEYDGDGGIFLPVPLMGTGESWPTMPWLGALGLAILFLLVTWAARRIPKTVLATGLLLALFPTYLVYCLSMPLPAPEARPASASYVALRGVYNDPLFNAVALLDAADEVDEQAMAVAVRAAEPAYVRSWELLDESADPGLDLEGFNFQEPSGRRHLVQVWEWRSTVYRNAGDPVETARSCHWLWRYLKQLNRPDHMSHTLVNSAIEGVVSAETYAALDVLSRDDRLALARQIVDFNATRTSWEEIANCERSRSENVDGWQGHWYVLLERWTGQRRFEPDDKHWIWMCQLKHQAVATLLATELALRAYHDDHASYPKGLEGLVPTYLVAVPADPCSAAGGPIVYRKADGGFTLYSRGYDQDDDNGRIPDAKWGPTDEWIDWTADGDLSLKEYFKEE